MIIRVEGGDDIHYILYGDDDILDGILASGAAGDIVFSEISGILRHKRRAGELILILVVSLNIEISRILFICPPSQLEKTELTYFKALVA